VLLLILISDIHKGIVGTISHAQGLSLTPALVTSLVDAPADNPGLGIAEYLNAASLRPETPGLMKGTD
jgi:hypothetical protein